MGLKMFIKGSDSPPRDMTTLPCPRCGSHNIGEHGTRFGARSTTVVECFDCSYHHVEQSEGNDRYAAPVIVPIAARKLGK